MAQHEVIVIGGGPAGLATAAVLKDGGIEAVVLEKSDNVAASWRRHYDRLHLHTVRWLMRTLELGTQVEVRA